MQTISAHDALAAFNKGRTLFLDKLTAVPAESVNYLKPGDDYSLGGMAVHVNFVLEHYAGVLDAIVAADFAECRPQDPAGLEERAILRAKSPLTTDLGSAEVAATRRLHGIVAAKVEALGSDWSRKAPVLFGDASEPHPTSAADVLGWLTGHYEEHVTHIAALVGEWTRESSPAAADPLAVVTEFNRAFARGDVPAVMALMTEDCIFDNTNPAPDGRLLRGQQEVRIFWEEFFATTDQPRFETEEIFALGDRVVARWRFSWGGGEGHVRGVDLFRVRDGKVAEKLAYVKG